MRKVLLILACLSTGILWAGGFYIEMGNPSQNSEAKSKNASIVMRLTGCHEAEKGQIEASAEGIVDGKRQSIPLRVISLSSPGLFAVQQQWPDEGNWVVKMYGRHPAFPEGTGAIVRVHGAKFEWKNMMFARRAATETEVKQALALRD